MLLKSMKLLLLSLFTPLKNLALILTWSMLKVARSRWVTPLVPPARASSCTLLMPWPMGQQKLALLCAAEAGKAKLYCWKDNNGGQNRSEERRVGKDYR